METMAALLHHRPEEDDEPMLMHNFGDFVLEKVVPPNLSEISTEALYMEVKAKRIQLDPAYQRDVVWDQHRASAFIRSIMQEFSMPPIIFCIKEINNDAGEDLDARKIRVCIDGKQRLTALVDFIDGKLPVTDSAKKPEKWYYSHPTLNGVQQHSRHKILPKEAKKFFRNRKLSCAEYHSLPKRMEEHLFQIVQRGMPLTPGERIRALSSPWAQLAREYEERYPSVLKLSTHRRCSDFRAIVTIFSQLLETARAINEDKLPTLQSSESALAKLLDDEDGPTDDVKAFIKDVFDRYQALVRTCLIQMNDQSDYVVKPDSVFGPVPWFLARAGIFNVKTFSPIEQLATAILIAKYKDTQDNGVLLQDIRKIREALRRNHHDLRVNGACFRTVWAYIDATLPLYH